MDATTDRAAVLELSSSELELVLAGLKVLLLVEDDAEAIAELKTLLARLGDVQTQTMAPGHVPAGDRAVAPPRA